MGKILCILTGIATANIFTLFADDCNRNGIEDEQEILSGSPDCDGNGILDECEVLTFIRFNEREEIRAEDPRAVYRIISLEMADLDGDQDLELIAGNSNSMITVFRNDGELGFSHLETFPLSEKSITLKPMTIQAIDMDLDSDLDLLVGCDGTQRFIVLLNLGDGRFEPPTSYTLGASTRFDPRLVLARDYDGDGYPDIAVGRPDRGLVTLFKNDGTGNLDLAGNVVTTSSERWLFWEDFDGDGQLDFLSATDGPADSSIVRNNGGGEFARPNRFVLNHSADQLAWGDFNGDGSLDLVYSISSDWICLRLNRGDGVFGQERCFRIEEPERLLVGDVDGDLDLDLVIGNKPLRSDQGSYATISILLNDGDGIFRHAGETEIDKTYMFFLGDIDSSGGLDIIVTTWEPSAMVIYRQEASQTGADCNANGILDVCEVASGDLHDDDRNGIPDECEGFFHWGDSDGSGDLDITDSIFTLKFLFLGGAKPSCLDAVDSNNDGALNVTDVIFLLGFIFLGSEAPPVPGVPGFPCGRDTALPGWPGHLGCEGYNPCR